MSQRRGAFGEAIVATIIPITIAPKGNRSSEIQKNDHLLRPFFSAARPISQLIGMTPRAKMTNRRESGSMRGDLYAGLGNSFSHAAREAGVAIMVSNSIGVKRPSDA